MTKKINKKNANIYDQHSTELLYIDFFYSEYALRHVEKKFIENQKVGQEFDSAFTIMKEFIELSILKYSETNPHLQKLLVSIGEKKTNTIPIDNIIFLINCIIRIYFYNNIGSNKFNIASDEMLNETWKRVGTFLDKINKSHTEKDIDILDLFFSHIVNSNNQEIQKILNYFCNLSIKYGIHICDIKNFRSINSSFDGLDISYLDNYATKRFPLLKNLSLEYYNSLSPDEFLVEYGEQTHINTPPENILAQNYAKKFYTFFINIESDKFDITKTISTLTRDLSIFIVDYKKANNKTITEQEKKLYKEHHPTISNSQFDINGAQNRLIGIKIWDLCQQGYNNQNAIYEILDPVYREIKEKIIGKNEKKPMCVEYGSCQLCPDLNNCNRYLSILLRTADLSIKECRIASTNIRKRLK